MDRALEVTSGLSSLATNISGGCPPEPGVLLAVNISVDYPQKPGVLQGVAFTVGAGEMMGLIGPSGSGKSVTPTDMTSSKSVFMDGSSLQITQAG